MGIAGKGGHAFNVGDSDGEQIGALVDAGAGGGGTTGSGEGRTISAIVRVAAPEFYETFKATSTTATDFKCNLLFRLHSVGSENRFGDGIVSL